MTLQRPYLLAAQQHHLPRGQRRLRETDLDYSICLAQLTCPQEREMLRLVNCLARITGSVVTIRTVPKRLPSLFQHQRRLAYVRIFPIQIIVCFQFVVDCNYSRTWFKSVYSFQANWGISLSRTVCRYHFLAERLQLH